MADFLRPLSFGRFSRSTTGLLFYTFSLLYLLSLGYYHFASYRDPTSYFFNPLRAYERPENGVPTICVGIATVRRRGEQYVGLTVASLLAGLTETERESIFLNLLIANTEPSQHPIYSEKWAETLPDRVLTYRQDDPDFERIKKWEDDGWYRNKTIYDYTHLMQDCYDTGAQYVAMIEDDTLAVKGWLPSALQALDIVKQRTVNERWIYLRLFYVDDLLG
ncbi:unnamed protein product [Penicillium nalgiovense]|nr:unnamed protein product [Penicillium nalgiovense]